MNSFIELPTISLDDWTQPGADRPLFADRLRDICHRIGFFRVTGHGIDPSFLSDYFGAMRRFFELSDEAKSTIDKARSPWFRGWERVGTEYTDNQVDYREQIDIWTELPARRGDIDPAYLRLEGPNQWPADELVPGFRGLVERFQREMGTLADELMSAMAVGLGLESDHFERLFGEPRMSLVKLIHYPPTPSGGAGVNAHHDSGFLTVLWQHGVPGLQVENQNGDWIDVPADGDTFVVNIGEMLQAMTGNYFVATMHRVVTATERYSSGYFHGPALTTRLDPIPLDQSFVDAVAASPHHRAAGFMAQPDDLAGGARGTNSEAAPTYGQQLWNYFSRSYPTLAEQHLPGPDEEDVE